MLEYHVHQGNDWHRDDVTVTYSDDVTLTTSSCVRGTCSVINVSYSRSRTRGIFRRSHLYVKKEKSANKDIINQTMFPRCTIKFSQQTWKHMSGSKLGEFRRFPKWRYKLRTCIVDLFLQVSPLLKHWTYVKENGEQIKKIRIKRTVKNVIVVIYSTLPFNFV